MNKKNLHVLSNIIAAVESGGQVYSEARDWTAYAGAGANTANEVTCTLGPYQAYGAEAQELIQYIFDKHPDVFRQCDPNNIIKLKLTVSWVGTRWNPSPAEKAILIKMLATQAGHEASEAVFTERLNKYIARATAFGVADVGGLMMWAEVQHLGGVSAAERVFRRAGGYFTAEHILDCLRPEYADLKKYREPVECQKFWTRHKKCVEFIKKYADFTDAPDGGGKGGAMQVTAEQIINKARSYIGYREKDHAGADLENFTADAGDGNYTKFSALCGYGIQPWQWCQLFVCGVAVEVCGSISAAEHLLCDQDLNDGVLTSYTPEGSGYFKEAGRWYTTPAPGDVVYFYSGSMGRICHVGYVESVNTGARTFTTIEGNTNNDGFTTNGGCVARHEYSYANVGGGNRVAGFGRPRYAQQAQQYTGTRKLVADGQQHSINFTGHIIEVDGIRGPETTKNMVRCLQRAANIDWQAGLVEDGEIGPKTRAAFNGHYIKKGERQKMVTAAEIICLCLGRNPNGVEYPGVFGDGLAAALGTQYISGPDLLKLVD